MFKSKDLSLLCSVHQLPIRFATIGFRGGHELDRLNSSAFFTHQVRGKTVLMAGTVSAVSEDRRKGVWQGGVIMWPMPATEESSISRGLSFSGACVVFDRSDVKQMILRKFRLHLADAPHSDSGLMLLAARTVYCQAFARLDRDIIETDKPKSAAQSTTGFEPSKQQSYKASSLRSKPWHGTIDQWAEKFLHSVRV